MGELASMGVNGQHAFLIYTDSEGVNRVLEHGDPYYAYDGSKSLYQGELKDFLRYRLGTLSFNPYVGAGLLRARASSLDTHWQVTNNGFFLELGVCNSRTKKLLLDLTIRYCHVDFDIDPNLFSGTHRIRSLGSFASIGYKF